MDQERFCQTLKHFNMWALEYNHASSVSNLAEKQASFETFPTKKSSEPQLLIEHLHKSRSGIQELNLQNLQNYSLRPFLRFLPQTSNHETKTQTGLRSLKTRQTPLLNAIQTTMLQILHQRNSQSPKRKQKEYISLTGPASKRIVRDLSEANIIQGSRARKRVNFALKMQGIDDESFYYSAFVGATLSQTQNRNRPYRSDLPPPKTWRNFLHHLYRKGFETGVEKNNTLQGRDAHSSVEHGGRWRDAGPDWALMASLFPILDRFLRP